ncbi:hypothetical protein PROFUN_08648 [Planoprotostelium fungivorum]|uniref:Uncharacterized protein n=1 Tax=Planoprotostelium fungivorum TaxID=1890364 RepID=A0A2P6NJ49_9EUKA|nr:hypothetical protein PROFUN_08648 [Planoprotostelium fungivorum]
MTAVRSSYRTLAHVQFIVPNFWTETLYKVLGVRTSESTIHLHLILSEESDKLSSEPERQSRRPEASRERHSSLMAYLESPHRYPLRDSESHDKPRPLVVVQTIDFQDTQNLALAMIDSDDRGIMTFDYPLEGSIRHFSSVNAAAHDLLRDFSFSDDFWLKVDQVGDTGEDINFTSVTTEALDFKLRRIQVGDERKVVITVEKPEEQFGEEPPFYQEAAPMVNLDDPLIQYYIDAVENDFISRVAGISSVMICLTTETALAGNLNMATIHGLSSIQEIRGKSVHDLGYSVQHVEYVSRLYYSYYNYPAEGSSFVCKLNGVTTHHDHKTICPNVTLSVILVEPHEVKPITIYPSPLRMWRKSQWDDFIESLLVHAQENLHIASLERHIVPDSFKRQERSMYCYVFRGRFLPSGSKDGLKWGSSCNVASIGRLQKRYFYTTLENGNKIKRRVMWITEIPQLCVVEYKHLSYCGPILFDHLVGMDWEVLITAVSRRSEAKMLASLEHMSARSNMVNTLGGK